MSYRQSVVLNRREKNSCWDQKWNMLWNDSVWFSTELSCLYPTVTKNSFALYLFTMSSLSIEFTDCIKHTITQPQMSLFHTIVIFGRPIIGFINSRSEALVAASSPDHILTWTVEGEELVFSVNLRHGRLEALQRAGLLQAEGRSEFYRSGWSWGDRETHKQRQIKGRDISSHGL